VAEAAATAIPHEIKGQAIHAFAILRAGHDPSDALAEKLRQHLGHEIGPIAKPEMDFFCKRGIPAPIGFSKGQRSYLGSPESRHECLSYRVHSAIADVGSLFNYEL
jgi:hypothetical protein